MPSPPPVTPEPQFIKCVHARLSDSYLQLVPLCCFPLSPGGLLLVSIWRQAVEWAPLFLGPVLQRMQLGKVRRGGLACYSGGEGTDDKAQRHLTIVLWYFVKSSLFFPSSLLLNVGNCCVCKCLNCRCFCDSHWVALRIKHEIKIKLPCCNKCMRPPVEIISSITEVCNANNSFSLSYEHVIISNRNETFQH